MNCPNCSASKVVKYGHTHYGKQRFRCRECGRQFVEDASRQPISSETRELVDRCLDERLSLAAICRITGVSERWLQYYINQKYYSVEKEVKPRQKKRGKLVIELDEMWSFVGSKGNQVWIWFAVDSLTKEIVGVHLGSRGRKDAQQLWKSLPPVYRQCAVCYTDFWEAYEQVLPSQRHRSVGKKTGKTNHVERLNNTVRQRVARLVRQTLSFSKKIENHIGAIWCFVHHYNASLQT